MLARDKPTVCKTSGNRMIAGRIVVLVCWVLLVTSFIGCHSFTHGNAADGLGAVPVGAVIIEMARWMSA